MVPKLGHPVKKLRIRGRQSLEKIQKLITPVGQDGLMSLWANRFLPISIEFTRIVTQWANN
jgi:hypothetical protein